MLKNREWLEGEARKFIEAQNIRMLYIIAESMGIFAKRALLRDRLVAVLVNAARDDEILMWAALANTERQPVTFAFHLFDNDVGEHWYIPKLAGPRTPYAEFLLGVTYFAIDSFDRLQNAVEAHRWVGKIEGVQIVWRYY